MGKGTKVTTGIVGVVIVIVASWFGLDLGGESAPASSTFSTAPVASSSSTRPAMSPSEPHSPSGMLACKQSSLPPETDEVIDDILAGGPFKYPNNDGVRFGNYEGVLPAESRNFYREYTVDTPGLNHRGTLRIITGGGSPTDPDIWYYTADHYESFCELTDAEEK